MTDGRTNRGSMVEASERISNHAGFIWSVADLLRGDYKQSEYGRVILPLTVFRRLNCVLDPVEPAMLEKHEQVKGKVGQRRHSSLGMLSPIEYELRHADNPARDQAS